MTALPVIGLDQALATAAAIALTLGAYALAMAVYRRAGHSPLLNPVMVGIALVIGVLQVGELDYLAYFEGARILHFLLGTATVALAIPLHQQLQQLRGAWLPIVLSVAAGATTAALSTVLIAALLGASEPTLLSLIPKSTTTPVAMGIAERLGGLPAMAAAAVILTGIFGAIVGLGLLRWLGYRNPRTLGVALGVAAHGIGTARALQVDRNIAAYSGLAMGLSALFTALLAPVLWWLLGPMLVPGI